MKEQHSNAQTKDARMLRRAWQLLIAVMVLCAVLVVSKPGIQQLHKALTTAPADALTAQAIGDIEISLQKQEDEQYMLIPGAPAAQKLTVSVTAESDPCWTFVTVEEKNGADEYLNWQIADGWTQLTADGEAVDGVYYRERPEMTMNTWNVLKDDRVIANPETVTKSVLSEMAQLDQAQWPRLTYSAWAISRDGLDDPSQAWNIIQQETWTVAYDTITADAGFTAALAMPEGLALHAYDVNLLDEVSRSVQPVSAMQVSLPVPEGTEAALVLHVLDSHDKIVNAIEDGKAIGLNTVDGSTTIVEALDATVENGMATFTTGSFSTYYVVSGHGSTLENWWETTQVKRYNFDSEVYGLDADATTDTPREFVVEPDSTFYLYLKGNLPTGGEGPVAGTWTVTSDNTNGRIMMTTAGDGVGKVISVSADAVSTDKLTITANNWIVTIKVVSAGDIIEAAYDNVDYPVYIGITLDAQSISIGNEPRISGYDNNAWVYVTGMTSEGTSSTVTINGSSGAYEQYKTVAPLAGSKGADYLTKDIKTVKMLENTDDKSVKGIIDSSLDTSANGAIDIRPYIQNIDWEGIKAVLLNNSSVASQLKATDGVAVSTSNQSNYELRPYVVKIQTSNFIGWHINACFVPVSSSDGWVYFDENLDESLGQEVEFLNVPARRPWNGGKGTTASMYYVNPKEPGSNYVKVSVSEYVTLTNGQKLRFMGWNTMPEGTGDMYSGEGGVFDSPNTKTEHVLVANGTLYAFWDSTLDRLEIHKDLLIDADQDASGRYKTDFTFTVKLTLPNDLQIDSDMKIIAEEFYVADDSLVANSQQSIGLQSNQKEYTITFTFNEDQYGVVYAPKGTTYTVTETLPSGNDYTLIGSQNDKGTIQGVGEGSIVRFTNGWKNTTGLLRVSKEVQLAEGQTVENWNTIKFPFTVTMTAPQGVADPTYTYQRYDSSNIEYGDPITVEGNTISLELAHNESVVFSGIKEGTVYTVTEGEVENSEFTPETATMKGTIERNTQLEAHFINRIVETNGTLTITKAFSGCTPEAGESFVFTVEKVENGVATEEFAKVVIYGKDLVNGKASKTLSVPYGQYTVTEDDSWSWRYTATVNPTESVTVSSKNTNPTVTFTNTKTNPNWLDSSAGVTNVFEKVTVPQATDSSGN